MVAISVPMLSKIGTKSHSAHVPFQCKQLQKIVLLPNYSKIKELYIPCELLNHSKDFKPNWWDVLVTYLPFFLGGIKFNKPKIHINKTIQI